MFLARGLCYVISVESIPIRGPLFTAIAQGWTRSVIGLLLVFVVLRRAFVRRPG